MKGDDADDAATLLKAGIGKRAHQTDVGAAIDELNAPLAEQLADRLGGLLVRSFIPEIGAAKHAYSSKHGPILSQTSGGKVGTRGGNSVNFGSVPIWK
jgi:hypothetical protein